MVTRIVTKYRANFVTLILTISGRSTKKITILGETNGGKIVTQIVTKIGDYSIT